MEIKELLKAYFEVPHEYLDKLAKLFIKKEIKAGSYLFKKNQSAVPLAFLLEGHIRIFDLASDKEITQWISAPGDFITDILGLVFEAPNRWNAIAITNLELLVMENSVYKSLNETVPEWAELEKQFMAKCFRILEERVFTFLSKTAKERYDDLLKEKGDLLNQVPLQYLASMLGMSAETFSRVRKQAAMNS